MKYVRLDMLFFGPCSLQVEHIYQLEPVMNTGGDNRFYLTRPEILSMNHITEHIKSDSVAKTKRNYHIIFVPRRLASCEHLLEKAGVYGYVTMLEWSRLNFIPLDEDLLSLEYPDTARTLILDGNFSVLHSVASSILALEEQFGVIPLFHGKGQYSKMVWEMVVRMKEARGLYDVEGKSRGLFSEIILFDRNCDWVTPMCSQLTYEGMLDDVFTIENGFVRFNKEITGKSDVKVLLNEKDPVFSLIRSMHFSGVSKVLLSVTKELKDSFGKGRERTQSIREMKEFVKILPKLKQKHESLAMHLKASDTIIRTMNERDFERQLTTEWMLLEGVEKRTAYDFIEEAIESQLSHYIPLQLLCLASATNDGIKAKYYDSFKRTFFHSYGHKHVVSFHNLSRAGILKTKSREEPSSFHPLSQMLKLVPKNPAACDVKNPTDASYVFGGAYIPLSCAAISHVISRHSWKALEDKRWEGTTFSVDQPVTQRKMTNRPGSAVLVYFIGGCSYSEVSALRFMGKKLNQQIIIATTDIINWKRTLNSFMEMEVAMLS